MGVVNYDNFKWCSVSSILKVVGAVNDAKWPLHVDLSEVIKQVPALEDMDKERKVREEQLIKEGRARETKGR